MATCDQFLLAGLCREIGPDGDLQAAYQRWYSALGANPSPEAAPSWAAYVRREKIDADIL